MIDYIRHRKVQGIDERILKILNKSYRNAATLMFLGFLMLTMYYELFYELNVPVITLHTMGCMIGAGALVFLISVFAYHKSRDL